MRPTDVLKNEHRSIELMLSVLQKACAKLESNQPVELTDLDGLLDFFRGFADRCHHMKEERLLFPALEQAGFPRDAGPVAVMLHEHTVGRAHIGTMSDALSKMKAGEMEASLKFVGVAKEYVALLSEHISKEDNILFPMADARLGGEVQANLLREFDRVEREEIGESKHEQYHLLISRLRVKYPT